MNIVKLPIKEISKGVRLCYSNARDLCEESELLFSNEKYARALALSILANEELGKIKILLFLGFEKINKNNFTSEESKHYNDLFKNHRKKICFGKAIELINPEALNKIGAKISRSNNEVVADLSKNAISNTDILKQNALYVSMVNSKFTNPSNFISAKMVKPEIQLTKERIEAIKINVNYYQNHPKILKNDL